MTDSSDGDRPERTAKASGESRDGSSGAGDRPAGNDKSRADSRAGGDRPDRADRSGQQDRPYQRTDGGRGSSGSAAGGRTDRPSRGSVHDRPLGQASQVLPAACARNPLAGGTPRTIGPRGIPTGRAVLTAREARIAERPIATATIGRIAPAPTVTGRSAGTAIGRTGRPVRTAATGPMATVHAPRARTVTAPTVIAPRLRERPTRRRLVPGRIRLGTGSSAW